MKKFSVLSLILLTGAFINLVAQYEIGFHYSPNISFRTMLIKYDPFGLLHRDQENSSLKFCNSAGIDFGQHITQALTFKTGIWLSAKGFKIHDNCEFDTLRIDMYRKDEYRYLEVPVTLRFKTNKEQRINYTIESGIAYNVYLNSKEIQTGTGFFGEDINRKVYSSRREWFNYKNFSYLAQAGISFAVNKKLVFNPAVYTELMLNNYLNDKEFEGSNKFYLHTIGLKCEVIYDF